MGLAHRCWHVLYDALRQVCPEALGGHLAVQGQKPGEDKSCWDSRDWPQHGLSRSQTIRHVLNLVWVATQCRRAPTWPCRALRGEVWRERREATGDCSAEGG